MRIINFWLFLFIYSFSQLLMVLSAAASLDWQRLADTLPKCAAVEPNRSPYDEPNLSSTLDKRRTIPTTYPGRIVEHNLPRIDCGTLLISSHPLDEDKIVVQGLLSAPSFTSATRQEDRNVVRALIEQSVGLHDHDFQEIVFDHIRLEGPLIIDRLNPRAAIKFRHVVFDESSTPPIVGEDQTRFSAPNTKTPIVIIPPEEGYSLIINGSEFNQPLSFENVHFKGALWIEDNTFHGQLRFDRMRFYGPVVIANSFFDNDLLFHSKRNRASGILYSSNVEDRNVFHDQLLISNVDLKGDIDLTDTLFTGMKFDRTRALAPFTAYNNEPPILEIHEAVVEDSIKLIHVEVDPLCTHLGDNASCFQPSVTLADSRLLNKLDISDSEIPWLQISKSELSTAYIDNNRFLTAIMRDNRMQSLEFKHNYVAQTMSLVSNQSRGPFQIFKNNHADIQFRQAAFLDSAVNWGEFAKNARVLVSGNKVQGDFSFAPMALGQYLKKLDLRKNSIDGDSQIWLPTESSNDTTDLIPTWQDFLPLDITSNRVSGSLFIQTSKVNTDRTALSLVQPPPTDALLGMPDKLDAVKRGCGPAELMAIKLMVSISSVSAKTLSWELPFDNCQFRWEGHGFEFQHWGDNSARYYQSDEPLPVAQDRWNSLEHLLVWRGMADKPSPEVDRYLGDHLIARGEFSDGRELHLLARKGNYIPQEHRTFEDVQFAELERVDYSFFRPLREIGRNLQDVFCRGEADNPIDECEDIYYPVIRLLMSPSGYGAKPEWSLLLIISLWAVGGGYYWLYSFYNRREWKQFTIVKPKPDLEEAPLDFKFNHGSHERIAKGPYRATFLPRRIVIMFDFLLGARRTPEHLPGDGRIITDQPGFLSYDTGLSARNFSVMTFSLDAVLPVIDLHCYSRYYPRHGFVRFFSHFQHIMGWWLATNLIAAAAIGFG